MEDRAAPHTPSRWSSLPLFLLPPPYTTPQCAGFLSAPCVGVPAPGALLVLAVPDPEQHWPLLREQVPPLRSRFAACPLVLRAAPPPTPELLDCVRRMGALRIRAVLCGDGPSPALLRRAMTDPVDLGDDVVEWLCLRDLRPSPSVADVIRRLFRRADQHLDIGALLRSLGEHGSTVRRHFHAEGFPSPGCWLEVGRALHAALWLQRDPSASVLTVARGTGYSDHSALSHQTFRLFGIRPGRIRELLGWEWLLDRWVQRAVRRAAAGGR